MKIQATYKFDKKIAKKLVDAQYYAAIGINNQHLELIEKEKIRLSTPKTEEVSKLLYFYKNLGLSEEGTSPVGKILLGLYRKNKESAMQGKKTINTNILSIVSHPETLLIAYRAIRGNKGALTPGADLSNEELNKLNESQLKIYTKSNIFPDGFSLQDVLLCSRLLRLQIYPWGISSRIEVDKPGVATKKRPITIPPFMDRVVQKAIELVLHSIYEPDFEILNRSFGFRPNKGVHDAMALIRSTKTNGMKTAIEGDVKAAYDTVDKDILLGILSRKIKDSKFLKLMKQRLNYSYIKKDTGEKETPILGIPQGGIDSPYLFNIYMHELDLFVQNEINEYINNINNLDKKKNGPNKLYSALTVTRRNLLWSLNNIKSQINKVDKDPNITEIQRNAAIATYKTEFRQTVRAIRINAHKKNRVSSIDESKRTISHVYVRYADDWILLTNGNKEIANSLKNKIAKFLSNTLKLQLSEEKTLITDITKEPAKFLGFEIRRNPRGKLKKILQNKYSKGDFHKFNLQKTGGVLVWTAPDKERLINRLHMKGFCKKNGFPMGIPWLSIHEPHVIIERFNASIRGLAQYYLSHIRNNSSIYRWIYILRYSCLKTLAQKYKTSITGIFHRYGHNRSSISTSTVRFKVQLTIKNETFEKSWTLLTYKDLVDNIPTPSPGDQAIATFWDLELRKKIGDYPLKKGKIPKVTNSDYLDAISWVSLRTQASFDMPCASCGSFTDIQMHHIKHVRKTAYVFIPEEKAYQRIMQLRNRKQIPLCTYCHNTLVHTGKYAGPGLRSMIPTTKLVDNRVLHVESFVKPGVEYHTKSLEEKGWKKT